MEDSVAISVRSFVAARAEEIMALSHQIDSSSGVGAKGFAFQHLPKHMRRRAVSHNVKRLPKRLRHEHIYQLDKSGAGIPKKPKKPSRKHRRRKSNLLLEYNRRQGTVKWIESHIWHAKRFHMESKWNYKIPISPCDKGYRAIYRAFRHHSAMQDISFFSCLEVSGPGSFICETFKRFSSPLVYKLSIGALFFTSGEREGNLHFYKDSSYPYGYIGQIKFSWCHYSATDSSTVWLWIHPAYKNAVLEQLIEAFELDPVVPETKPSKQEGGSLPCIDEIKLEPKHLDSRPVWKNQTLHVSLTDLEGSLNRIRLCGPESTTVLKEVLRTMNDLKSHKSTWLKDYYKEDDKGVLVLQDKFWSQVSSHHDFPAHVIIPLTVRDPRIFLPQKRHKPVSSQMQTVPEFQQLLQEYIAVAKSPLFAAEWRYRATREKMTDLEFSKRRGQLLIPGSDLDLGEDENQVPVLLIQQPDTGWDLILPAGWCMPFWISLSYRNVRAYGQRDAVHYAFEFGSTHSMELPSPDSEHGQQELESTGNETRETYFALPPDKRHNLIQLKCPFPFQIDWNLLLNYWRNRKQLPPDQSQFYVLRDFKLLQQLTQLLQSKTPFDSIQLPDDAANCLVGVRVNIVGKGKPEPNSIIYIPSTEDIQQYKTSCRTSHEVSYSEPPEDIRSVSARKIELRQKHQKHLAFLRKKRKKLRQKGEADGKFDSTLETQCYNEEVKGLSVPSTSEALLEQSRTPFGCVTHGGDCYSIGKCSGVGYVTLSGILELTQSQSSRGIVILRDSRTTLVYRIAKLKIC